MICLRKILTIVLLFCFGIIAQQAQAATLKNVSFTNQKKNATLTLTLDSQVKPKLTLVNNPFQLLIDLEASSRIQGLPVQFNGQNLMLGIQSGKAQKSKTRLVIPLAQSVSVTHTSKKEQNQHILTIYLAATAVASSKQETQPTKKSDLGTFINQKSTKSEAETVKVKSKADKNIANSETTPTNTVKSKTNAKRNAQSGQIVIAIDAGHGGKDPGAVGKAGYKEKTIALQVSQKLEKLLDADPMFKAVLTRTGDYYISVPERSDIARKQKANLLVSIHADAAPNREARGASVWVLSNKRANNEMAGWLEKQEKQSELLGGAGDVLASTQNDKYLSQAVIDLQFGHSQKVGYGAGEEVLQELRQIGKLHKKKPEHASLGVLRSPDIPSLLVEIGFISHYDEEQLLATQAYQNKLAQSMYKGIKRYFEAHPVNTSASDQIVSSSTRQSGGERKHKVQKGDTLGEIAKLYNVPIKEIKKANQMKNNNLFLGQTITIPSA